MMAEPPGPQSTNDRMLPDVYLPRCSEKFYGIFPPNLFLCPDNLHCMHFVLSLKHKKGAELKALTELLLHCGAHLSFNIEETSDFSAIIVDHNEIVSFKAPAFTIEYLETCLKESKLSQISSTNYRQAATSHIAQGVDCMNVVFFRQSAWEDLLSEADKLWFATNLRESRKVEVSNPRCTCNPVPPADLRAFNYDCGKSDTKKPKDAKHSRMPYSYNEQVNILKYITVHREYSRIKGRKLWTVMERRKICPNRTWQSMKEHFIKKIIKHLEEFDFLTENDKTKLRKGFY